MSFESRIVAFADRCLSDRTRELIVAPAVADLQYEEGAGRIGKAASRLAVLRAVSGGIREDAARHCGTFLFLALLPAGYYIFMFLMFFDLSPTATTYWSADVWSVGILVVILSLGPAVACFWPERQSRPVD
jgi:hypothetical protein